MAKGLSAAKEEAMKILGDKGKIPDPKVNLSKVKTDFDKAGKEYDAAVSVLQDKILAFQNGNSSLKNSIQQYEDQISKSELGLDKKDEEDKKKITKAQKVINDFLDSVIAECDANIKNLGALDKHTMAISEYENQCSQ